MVTEIKKKAFLECFSNFMSDSEGLAQEDLAAELKENKIDVNQLKIDVAAVVKRGSAERRLGWRRRAKQKIEDVDWEYAGHDIKCYAEKDCIHPEDQYEHYSCRTCECNHCQCEACNVLRRKDWPQFILWADIGSYMPATRLKPEFCEIDLDVILDRTGKLRDLASEWMETHD